MMGHDWGLVLSGGGARGAYEVGVVRYLAEVGFEPTAFAGASIGAINAAVLAAAPDLRTGAAALQRVWDAVDGGRLLRPVTGIDLDVSLGLLLLGGLAPTSPFIKQGIATFAPAADRLAAHVRLESGLLDDGYLRSLLDAELNGVEPERPLWLSVYRTEGLGKDLWTMLKAEAGLSDTPPSEYLLFQALEPSERLEALLASASLPIAFGARQVGGRSFRDGGMGGWQASSGNTPLEPLVAAGCRAAVVVHLSDGSFWDRHAYPNTAIIEVRPEQELHPEGRARSLLRFDSERQREWMEQGYVDARRCVGDSLAALGLRRAAVRTARDADAALGQLAGDRFDLELRGLGF